MGVPVDRRAPLAVSMPDVPGEFLADHLVNDHGLDPNLVRRQDAGSRDAQRHAVRYLQMQHAADHAQRYVGHEHNG